MVGFFQILGDIFSSHGVVRLVPDDKADMYLEALEDSYQKEPLPDPSKAVWWQGQGLHLDADGSIANEWSVRRENAQAFEDL